MSFGNGSGSVGGRRASAWKAGRLAVIAIGLLRAPAGVAGITCEHATAWPQVNQALAEIERSVDPCGESAAVIEVVQRFRQCADAGYRVCLDHESERNFLEQAAGEGDVTTITWNPELRTELEKGCGSDPDVSVRRDPTASLLHELVHAVQDCSGLDPTEHELEAVRIENIYRRSRQLCQRTRYGDQLLPDAMSVDCEPGYCSCGGTAATLANAARRRDATAARGHQPASTSLTAVGTAGDTAAHRAAVRVRAAAR